MDILVYALLAIWVAIALLYLSLHAADFVKRFTETPRRLVRQALFLD